MPIHIVESPEPYSEKSLDLLTDTLQIESDTSRLLTQELTRYCDGAIKGRSFLISGHRGAGKTTLVKTAALRLRKAAQRGVLLYRPLLIQINGPSLLPDTPPPPSPGEQGDPEMLTVLKQVTLALHRAVALEVAREFAEQAKRLVPSWRRDEAVELAAQLELDLFEAPDPARLREYWRRFGALQRGLLSTRWRMGADQGYRELVAVASVCEAYRRISGTFQRQEKLRQSAESTSSTTVGTAAPRDLSTPLNALLAGGVVGTGAAAGGWQMGAAFAGLTAALGTSLVLRHASSLSRERSISREYTFLYDLSVATLDRLLPILLDRLRAAGLAPVFLIDEMDKVKNLPRRMVGLLQHLKKLVSEETFACFLTDRSYFEAVSQPRPGDPYPVEHTYFSYREFVTYRASDFHAYLNEVLRLPQLPGPSRQPEPVEPDEAGAPREHAVQEAASPPSEDEQDRAVLSYVLLHRAQMHAIDLSREIAHLRSPEGTIALPPGRVRSVQAYALDVTMQLAIEIVLDEHEMQDLLAHDPGFRRLAHDAMYFLSRRWDRDGLLGMGDAGRREFVHYLEARMGETAPGVRARVDPEDVKFLFQRVQSLVSLLTDTAAFKDAFELWNEARADLGLPPVPPAVLGATQVETRTVPLLSRVDDETYEWNYDRGGHPRTERARRAAESQGSTEDRGPYTAIINAVRGLLDEVSGSTAETRVDFLALTSTLHLVATSPAWAEVEGASKRLALADRQGRRNAAFAHDLALLRSFAGNLLNAADAIAGALQCAAGIAVFSGTASAKDGTARALYAIAQAHQFGTRDHRVVWRVVNNLREEIIQITGSANLGAWRVPPLKNPEDAAGWARQVRASLHQLRDTLNSDRNLDEHAALAWGTWRERLVQFLTTRQPRDPTVEEIVTLAAEKLPATLLRFEPERMTVTDWSAAFVAASARTPVYGPCPRWLGVVSLYALGFRLGDGWSGVIQAFGSDEPAEGPPSDAWAWISSQEPPTRTALVIRNRTSFASEWLPDSVHALLALTPEELRRLDEPVLGMLEHLGFERVVIENPQTDRRLNDIRNLLRPLRIGGPESMLLAYPDLGAAVRPDPYIIAPRNAEELFRPPLR